MRRMAFAVVAFVACCAPEARADTLPLIEGVPMYYTPGQTFTFQVLVPQLSNFTNYAVELVFATTVPNPPLFVYSTAASPAPAGNYVFPSNANFQSGSTLTQDSPNISLTFTDSTSTPVTTATGVNDAIATVTVIPDATLTGTITLLVGGGTQFSADPPEGINYPTPGPFVIQQNGAGTGGGGGGGTGGNPVPAPPAAVLLGIGGLLLGARSRFCKQAVPAIR